MLSIQVSTILNCLANMSTMSIYCVFTQKQKLPYVQKCKQVFEGRHFRNMWSIMITFWYHTWERITSAIFMETSSCLTVYATSDNEAHRSWYAWTAPVWLLLVYQLRSCIVISKTFLQAWAYKKLLLYIPFFLLFFFLVLAYKMGSHSEAIIRW